MAIDPQFPGASDVYQHTVYTVVPAQTDYSFSWPYINQENYDGTTSPYVLVVHDSTEGVRSYPTFTMPSSSSIRLATAETEGTLIIMRQSWVNGLLVDFAGGATLSEATLDLAAKQLYYLWEESIAIGLDAFETNDDDQKFNAIFNFDGDGVLDSFRLTNSSITIDDEPSKIAVWVFVNGAFVQSDDYTLSQDTDNVLVVNLDRVPATGEFVEVRVAQFEALTAAIADGEIDCDKLAAGAICALSKFDLDGAGSARQVMGWDASTNFGARSLTHDDIGDFDTAVEAKRLDQFADPTANINMGGNKLTNGAAGTADTDFIIKSQLPLGDNFEVDSPITSFPATLTSGLTDGVWAVFVRCEHAIVGGGGASYVTTLSVNGVSRSHTVSNNPDGTEPMTYPLLVTVSGGTITINAATTNIIGVHGAMGFRISD